MADRDKTSRLRGPLGEALRALAEGLSDLPVESMLIGGMAVIARGVPRLTRDIDITIAGGKAEISEIVSVLSQHGFVARIDNAIDFAETNQVLLLRHARTRVDVDASLAWLPFELDALASANLLDVGGTRIRVARAEDLIVYKTVAWRPQDQQDVERLLILYLDKIDLSRIRRLVEEFGAALDAPERVEELEQIIARVRG